MGWNCLLLTIGLIIVMCAQMDASNNDELDLDNWKLGAWSEMCVADSGKTIPWRLLMHVSNTHRMIENNPDRIYFNGEYYNFTNKVYAMHDPASGKYVCSPWFFHPACLIYCPGFFCLPVIIAGALVSNKINN